jgi:hypothetical protein
VLDKFHSLDKATYDILWVYSKIVKITFPILMETIVLEIFTPSLITFPAMKYKFLYTGSITQNIYLDSILISLI